MRRSTNELDGKLVPLRRGRAKGMYLATDEAAEVRLPEASATIDELASVIESLIAGSRRYDGRHTRDTQSSP